jgi:hypothetical protein
LLLPRVARFTSMESDALLVRCAARIAMRDEIWRWQACSVACR